VADGVVGAFGREVEGSACGREFVEEEFGLAGRLGGVRDETSRWESAVELSIEYVDSSICSTDHTIMTNYHCSVCITLCPQGLPGPKRRGWLAVGVERNLESDVTATAHRGPTRRIDPTGTDAMGTASNGEIQGDRHSLHERMRHDHLITSKQLSRADIETVLDYAAEIDADPSAVANRHAGTVLGLLFFEPSTRTKMSFETAMKRLGGDIVDMGSVESSSVTKGETLADTVRVIEGTPTRSSCAIPSRDRRRWRASSSTSRW